VGLGVRFDPGVVEAPVGVLGGLLDELVSALAKSAKRVEGDCLEVDVQALGDPGRSGSQKWRFCPTCDGAHASSGQMLRFGSWGVEIRVMANRKWGC